MLTEEDVFVHSKSTIGPCTSIGTGTRINGPAFIDSSEGAPCRIGKYCAIAQNLCIRTSKHHTGHINLQAKFHQLHNFKVPLVSKGPVVVGNNVWIGDNVTIKIQRNRAFFETDFSKHEELSFDEIIA